MLPAGCSGLGKALLREEQTLRNRLKAGRLSPFTFLPINPIRSVTACSHAVRIYRCKVKSTLNDIGSELSNLG